MTHESPSSSRFGTSGKPYTYELMYREGQDDDGKIISSKFFNTIKGVGDYLSSLADEEDYFPGEAEALWLVVNRQTGAPVPFRTYLGLDF